MRWWPPQQRPSNITTLSRDCRPLGTLFRVSPRPFLVSRPNNGSPLLNNPEEPRTEHQTEHNLLRLASFNINTLLCFFDKHSYHNVNSTLQTINDISKHYCQPALIVTRRYVVAKLVNQRYALLITWQIIYRPGHTKLRSANNTNQSCFIAFIRKATKKGYIKLTTKI